MQINSDFLDNRISFSDLFLVDFTTTKPDPVFVDNIQSFGYQHVKEVEHRFLSHGFSIIEITSPINKEVVLELAKLLNLGKIFIPPLYKKGQYVADGGVSMIKSVDSNKDMSHKSFQSEIGIDFHCDGTLQPIGYVATSLLACKSPAYEGGDSILFNATAAYSELLEQDREAAISMSTNCSLVRQANLNGCSDMNIGPVFAFKDNELVCAYSITKTDSFVASYNSDIKAIERAMEFMKQASMPGSKYYYQLQLKEGQILIFANSKISHGRLPYKNTDKITRCMFRALFLNKVSSSMNENSFNQLKSSKSKEKIMNNKTSDLSHNEAIAAWWKFSKGENNLYKDTFSDFNNFYVNGGEIRTVKGPLEGGVGVKLNGVSQWLHNEKAILDTEESYTVAAWVRIDSDTMGSDLKFKEGEHAFTAVSQDALTHSAFYLGVREVTTKASDGLYQQSIRWNFTVAPIDGSETGAVEWQHVYTNSKLDYSVMDEWFLLVGVCDAKSRKISIYVLNNKEANTISMPKELILLPTDRGVQVGKGKWLSRNVDFWPGSVGPIKLFSKALTKEEIDGLAKENSL